MRPMIIFDDGLGQLGPMTDLRASFEVRTGMYTTAARICSVFPRALRGYWTPDQFAPVVGERAGAPVNELPDEQTLLCVNGRWAMPDTGLDLRPGDALLEHGSEQVVIALLHRADAEAFLASGQLPDHVHTSTSPRMQLFHHPWHIIGQLPELIASDLRSLRILDPLLPQEHAQVVGGHPVQIHASAELWPNIVLDATEGPIIIHESAVVRPNTVLCGPCSIGSHATVLDAALIKPNTVIGPVCKVAGEVGSTVFQGFSNKAHGGHLGDSWVGKWVNIGAGTNNSNLLNTYGEVLMRTECEGPMQRTGLKYLGAIVGDHVKLAIMTRIMTGSVLGTGAMIACTQAPPATVPRFAWITDAGQRAQKRNKFEQTMRAMMARRDREPTDAYLALVRGVYDRAAQQSAR